MYAAGSYNGTVGLYDEKSNELLYLLPVGRGVTKTQFSMDGKYLFSSSRQDDKIICWDIRQSGDILFEVSRLGETNQRISFDLDPTGQYLMSGDTSGMVRIWDLPSLIANPRDSLSPLIEQQVHQDVVSSAAFHPFFYHEEYRFISTCSGSRKFPLLFDDESGAEDDQPLDNSLRIMRMHSPIK